MTLRLTPAEDETLARLARELRMSKNAVAAQAIDLVAMRPSHADFVATSTERLLDRYSALFSRLAES